MNRSLHNAIFAVVSATSLIAACGEPTLHLETDKAEELAAVQARLGRSAADAPSLLNEKLESSFTALPVVSQINALPWAGHVWPVSEGSITSSWDGAGTESPARKYERAFGGVKVEEKVVRTAQELGRARTAAALLLPEPKRAVVRNEVEFKVQDLKALATLAHADATGKAVTLPQSSSAGAFHLVLTNYVGVMKQPIGWDRGAQSEPVRAFRITGKTQVTAAEANRLIGAPEADRVIASLDGAVAKDEWTHLGGFAVSANERVAVRMTGGGDADLFVAFDAQPTEHAYDCRPLAGGSVETCTLDAPPNDARLFVSVRGFAPASDFKVDIVASGQMPTAYVANPQAASFVHIQAEVELVSASPAHLDGNLATQIDAFTHTERLSYVLELDGAGDVLGGEWVGDSERAHPEALWLPVARAAAPIAGGAMSWANIKSLLDESVSSVEGSGAERTFTEDAIIRRGEVRLFGPYPVAQGSAFRASLFGTADADLYVRRASAPSLAMFDCRPYRDGSNESCAVSGGTEVFVAVAGYADGSEVRLTVSYREPSGAVMAPPAPPAWISHLNVSRDVAKDELQLFAIAVPAGAKLRIETHSDNDVDLYVSLEVPPTLTTYDQRGFTGSGNEALELTASSNGTLYVGVHGYQAALFTLTTGE